MANNKKYYLGGLFLIVTLLMTGLLLKTDQVAAKASLTISTVTSAHQIDSKKSYFYLAVKPNTEEQLTVNLTNQSAKDITVTPSLVSATTSENGTINYQTTQAKADSTLKYQLPDLATLPDKIVIPANSLKKVTIKLALPQQSFTGILAGALRFTEVADQPVQQKGIHNTVAYTIAVILREDNKVVVPELNLLKISAKNSRGKQIMTEVIQNPVANYLFNLSLKTQIYSKKTKQKVFENQQNGLQMAPNSHFTNSINLQNKLAAGEYRVVTVATSNQQRWKFNQTLKIVREPSLNQRTVSTSKVVKQRSLPIGMIILILIIVGLAMVSAYLWQRRKSQH
ncbi:DUF916 and DUF3324 domain-containing protein [Lapidilactobacillus bayanensis]|uniref:DUF916 and DUF3324 domain-containing protein n=1 Tax=Lapidilactobacillus bayanensis TaxID=2485998 RepID=UPI000F783D34|nr:DUF916 and DUF3324 domain-containing protein [Lapidilactobacillus bayanensis]